MSRFEDSDGRVRGVSGAVSKLKEFGNRWESCFNCRLVFATDAELAFLCISMPACPNPSTSEAFYQIEMRNSLKCFHSVTGHPILPSTQEFGLPVYVIPGSSNSSGRAFYDQNCIAFIIFIRYTDSCKLQVVAFEISNYVWRLMLIVLIRCRIANSRKQRQWGQWP